MQDVLNFFNTSMPVGYVVAAAIAAFVAWKTGVSAFNGVKGALGNFAPGSLAAALMFTTGIGGIGYSIGDLVTRSDDTPAAEQAAEVNWLSNDEIISLRDADDDNLRQLLQFAKDQNERQREFFVQREKALEETKELTSVTTGAEGELDSVEQQREFLVQGKKALEEGKELTLVPTSAEGELDSVDFTLLGEDTPEPVEDTSLTEENMAEGSIDKPQLPIQGTIGLLGACAAILISGVVTFIRQQA